MVEDEDIEEGEEVSDEEVQLALDILDDMREFKDWSFQCPNCHKTVFPVISEVLLETDKEYGLSFEDNIECGFLHIIDPKIHYEKLCPECTQSIYLQILAFIKGV